MVDIVRVGTVTAVDNDKRIARVKWLDSGQESDWMPVLINRDVIHYYPYTEDQWTEYETEPKVPPVAEKKYEEHRHKLIIKPYMPKVNDQVLAIFYPLPDRNGDGFILGGIQTWK